MLVGCHLRLQRRAADRASGAPPSEWVAFADVIEEHAPTNLKEYERLTSSGSRGALARFVYDVPDLIETPDELPAIFRRNLGAGRARHELDEGAIERTAELGIAPKNMRGDLPAILLTPKHDDAYPGLELPLTLAMTRSLGDFYMHTCGVTWKPEVVVLDLSRLLTRGLPAAASHGSGAAGGGDEPLEHLTLILASDGIWDLYETHEVFTAIASPPEPATAGGKPSQHLRTARDFFARSVDVGAEIFGSSADNMTGIVVYLNPEGTAVVPGGGNTAALEPKQQQQQQGSLPLSPPVAACVASTGGGSYAEAARQAIANRSASGAPAPPAPPASFEDEDDFGA